MLLLTSLKPPNLDQTVNRLKSLEAIEGMLKQRVTTANYCIQNLQNYWHLTQIFLKRITCPRKIYLLHLGYMKSNVLKTVFFFKC